MTSGADADRITRIDWYHVAGLALMALSAALVAGLVWALVS